MTNHAEAVARLAAKRWRIALALTAAMLTVYFGFILLIAYNKPLLATRLSGGLTLGILLGVLVIVAAFGLPETARQSLDEAALCLSVIRRAYEVDRALRAR